MCLYKAHSITGVQQIYCRGALAVALVSAFEPLYIASASHSLLGPAPFMIAALKRMVDALYGAPILLLTLTGGGGCAPMVVERPYEVDRVAWQQLRARWSPSSEAPSDFAVAAREPGSGRIVHLLPESLPKERRDTTPFRLRDLDPVRSIFEMARRPGLGILIVVYAVFAFAFNGVAGTSALFMIEKFSAETWQLSAMMMMAGVGIACSNTFLVPVWTPRLGERRSAVYSLIGLAVFYVTVFLAPLMWLAFALNMLGSMMSAFIFPAMTTLSVERVDHREAGMLLGVTSAVGSLMNILGPLGAGVVYDHVMRGAPYWTGSVMLVVAALILARRAAPRTAHSNQPDQADPQPVPVDEEYRPTA